MTVLRFDEYTARLEAEAAEREAAFLAYELVNCDEQAREELMAMREEDVLRENTVRMMTRRDAQQANRQKWLKRFAWIGLGIVVAIVAVWKGIP